MRVVVHLLGLEVLDLEVTTNSDEDSPDPAPPVRFGFHGSGPGVLDLSEDRDLDSLETYDRAR